MFKQYVRVCALFIAIISVAVLIPSRAAHVAPTAQPSAITPWGMNVYLTKNDRDQTGDNVNVLAATARNAGVQWTLEEFPWDLIEPNNNDWRTTYDADIKLVTDNGFGIIGMLLTSPRWARDAGCPNRISNYWCPPADVNEYAQFAAWMVERYDGDGVADALGSPRIAAWQIWNEPNDVELWPRLNGNEAARRARYGDMAVAAYSAIKAADQSATVILGGVYIFDGSRSDGFDFLNGANGVFQQVPAAKNAFDVWGIHPYMPTVAPDQPGLFPSVTLEGRLINARNWLSNDVGRPDAPIWITEIGWCSVVGSTSCPQKTEAEQAQYLIRSFVIAQQRGIQHINWLQMEDAFNNNHLWSGAAIIKNFNGSDYDPKTAYHAYQTLVSVLNNATPIGTGALNKHTYNPKISQTPAAVYDYRYVRDTTDIAVLWKTGASQTVKFALAPRKQWLFLTRAGQTFTPSINGTTATLTLSEDPIFVVQQAAP